MPAAPVGFGIAEIHQGAGNLAIQRLLSSGSVQAKLAISVPNDPAEQEADHVADHVMRMTAPALQRTCAACSAGASTCAECASDEGPMIQRKADKQSVAAQFAPKDILAHLDAAQPLDSATRAFMEPRFGRDFGHVRLHTDSKAAESASSVNAVAYTAGRDIVFAAGRFSPQTAEGRRLIAHELTHVVQQSQGAQQLQRWATCKPARITLEDCPPREHGEVQRAQSGPMVFLNSLKVPMTGEEGVLIANFDIGSATIKSNLHETIYWKEFLKKIAANRSRWKILGFTDCQGAEGLNQKLRDDRAAAVFQVLPPALRSQMISSKGAPIYDCITENTNSADRTLNRSVALVLETSVADFEPEEIEVCVPPAPQVSPGKRCKFYVYDSTEPSLTTVWKASAFALATPRPGAYVIPSGNNIEEALKGIFDTYAAKDCGCTEEVQFWSHGSPGNAMSVTKSNDELTSKDFDIPELNKYGDGPTSMPGYREWHDKLTTRQRRLVLLRRTICDPDSEIYYRSCQAFQGTVGQEFAKRSTEFWRSTVVGHTKIIALTQPGKKVLKPCQEPYWSELEGTEQPSPKKPIGVGAEQKPKKD